MKSTCSEMDGYTCTCVTDFLTLALPFVLTNMLVQERAPDAVYVDDPTANFTNMNDSLATMLW